VEGKGAERGQDKVFHILTGIKTFLRQVKVKVKVKNV
jgi:hypothetical protein